MRTNPCEEVKTKGGTVDGALQAIDNRATDINAALDALEKKLSSFLMSQVGEDCREGAGPQEPTSPFVSSLLSHSVSLRTIQDRIEALCSKIVD